HINTYGDPAQWPYDKFITGDYDKAGNFVQFAPKLKSEGGKFDPDEWAQLFADAGARFAGPVAEHHDGFSMWASKVNPWNAKDMGPHLDLVGLLTKAIRKKNMKVILSMHHAYNITGYYDAVPPTHDSTLQILYGQQGKEKNEALWLNKHKEIIDNYKPDIIWQDFNLTAISQPVLLNFLAYYYNQAGKWGKEVVTTYKDGLNKHCAVLDFERGGPTDLTSYYWLTDDAISSSSWCYTEGIGYYSKKQILHGFLDRISKNGNLLLNISPKADGTIPQEQKDVLLAMGQWLKKYGEAVYSTRAWVKYGEGPTKMGAGHGVFTAPAEGTAKDVRYTRSKDNSVLYAILLGWEPGQQEVVLHSLSSGRINLQSLKDISLINNSAGNYVSLSFRQDTAGLHVNLPEKNFDEMAYVLKLSFKNKIPPLDRYVDLNSSPYYNILPSNSTSLAIGLDGMLAADLSNPALQWKLERTGKGLYFIHNRNNPNMVVECNDTGASEPVLRIGKVTGADNQIWKIEAANEGLLHIMNKKFPEYALGVTGKISAGTSVSIVKADDSGAGWNLSEVCEMKQIPFSKNTVPGTIQAEDFDLGCPGEAWYDTDETNTGGKYRPDEGVDIEVCSAGGYNVGWTKKGEWLAYTMNVKNAGNYLMKIYVATVSDDARMHAEIDGKNLTGEIQVMNTGGFQNWKTITKTIKLDAGRRVLKLYMDEVPTGLNLDKISFERK
ncbi:MAG TPA: alpha-L-fucosidase, partial [Bacteroidales bacterium]|nr:alpha-L-fucosidase [Bacteroidales bacterium]